MRFIDNNHVMQGMDANSLRALARYFREQSRIAISRAVELEQREAASRKFRRFIANHPYMTEADKRASDRRNRNIEIVRLASRGWTNSKIGEKFGLNPATVGRIIRREIDRDEAGWHGRLAERENQRQTGQRGPK